MVSSRSNTTNGETKSQSSLLRSTWTTMSKYSTLTKVRNENRSKKTCKRWKLWAFLLNCTRTIPMASLSTLLNLWLIPTRQTCKRQMSSSWSKISSSKTKASRRCRYRTTTITIISIRFFHSMGSRIQRACLWRQRRWLRGSWGRWVNRKQLSSSNNRIRLPRASSNFSRVSRCLQHRWAKRYPNKHHRMQFLSSHHRPRTRTNSSSSSLPSHSNNSSSTKCLINNNESPS